MPRQILASEVESSLDQSTKEEAGIGSRRKIPDAPTASSSSVNNSTVDSSVDEKVRNLVIPICGVEAYIIMGPTHFAPFKCTFYSTATGKTPWAYNITKTENPSADELAKLNPKGFGLLSKHASGEDISKKARL